MNQAFKAKAMGKTVVLIDDDLYTRDRLQVYLHGCGLSVVTFDSAVCARDYLEHESPDIVITDLRSPELSGLDLLRAINQLDNPVPVILMSGIGNVSDVAQALRLGAADYLIKPILDFDVVVHAVDQALNMQLLKQENEAYKERLETINQELLHTVQLLERDQQAAKQVQRNLLPITPVSYGGITLSHRILPSLYLSGDFIDYGYVHQRYIAYYLTDVSGHGASSAFVTVWLKQLVRRLFREQQLFQDAHAFKEVPAQLLEVVNRELMQSRFFSHLTSVVGVIDADTREMSYVIAGHLPLPLLITPEGAVEFLEGKGKPVGLFENATWRLNTVKLPKGFQLVIFSDGILETLPDSDLIDKEQRLLTAVKACVGQEGYSSDSKGASDRLAATLSLDAIASGLGLEVDQEAPDDIAMVLIQDASSPIGV